MDANHGRVWWSELWTRDPAGAKDYYGQVAGWTFAEMPMAEGPYHIASRNGEMTAGIMDLTGMPGMDDTPPHWFTYLAVDDVEAAVAATKAAGGQVLRDPWDVPGVGRIAIVTDPTGAAVGIMTPAAS
jgi:predicted enzyme related to lactoylglutathione lyase